MRMATFYIIILEHILRWIPDRGRIHEWCVPWTDSPNPRSKFNETTWPHQQIAIPSAKSPPHALPISSNDICFLDVVLSITLTSYYPDLIIFRLLFSNFPSSWLLTRTLISHRWFFLFWESYRTIPQHQRTIIQDQVQGNLVCTILLRSLHGTSFWFFVVLSLRRAPIVAVTALQVKGTGKNI